MYTIFHKEFYWHVNTPLMLLISRIYPKLRKFTLNLD